MELFFLVHVSGLVLKTWVILLAASIQLCNVYQFLDMMLQEVLRSKNVKLSDGLIAETSMCSLEYLMVIVPTDRGIFFPSKKEEPSSIYKGHNGS